MFFPWLLTHLSYKPTKYRSLSAFSTLIGKFDEITTGQLWRYRWRSVGPKSLRNEFQAGEARWGCDYPLCPRRDQIRRRVAQGGSASLKIADKTIQSWIDDWKLCADCLGAGYCSRDCQKKHWREHRRKCVGKDGRKKAGKDVDVPFDVALQKEVDKEMKRVRDGDLGSYTRGLRVNGNG
jgi:hypothetical protein